VGLKGSPDLAAARVVAQHIASKHHEIVFTVEEGINALSDVIYHLETFDTTTVRAATPMYLMARKIKSMGAPRPGVRGTASRLTLSLSRARRREDGAVGRRV
jgi:asparagine synthetase B (glutamine-hydrolysing)